MKPIRGIYAWYFQMIEHLNKPLGSLGKFSNADSGARAFITLLFGLPISIILDLLLPINFARFPLLLGLSVMVLGIIFTKNLDKSRFRSDEFRAIKRWRESFEDSFLWFLEIITFIMTIAIYLLLMYFWKFLRK